MKEGREHNLTKSSGAGDPIAPGHVRMSKMLEPPNNGQLPIASRSHGTTCAIHLKWSVIVTFNWIN